MNRRDFLKRMAALGLLLPSTKTIVDMGANIHRRSLLMDIEFNYAFGPIVEWQHICDVNRTNLVVSKMREVLTDKIILEMVGLNTSEQIA